MVERKQLSLEERRERRRLRREKQRGENLERAEKMHIARLAAPPPEDSRSHLSSPAYVGCSGWFYWKWRGKFYPQDMPTGDWFSHYAEQFDTVEINASFYSWPTVANVKSWLRQPGEKEFVYTVKVCELITHIRKFDGVRNLVKDFGLIADVLGDRMGCFLFQMPPSYRYSRERLDEILGQLDHGRRNVVEFRHASWWNETVYAAFREHGTIFCSCSGPRLPDDLVRTADEVYLRLHKVGLMIGADLARCLAEDARVHPDVGIYILGTVQEEIGSRGAKTAAFNIAPRTALACDMGVAMDYPRALPEEQGKLDLGKGPGISQGANTNPVVYDLLISAARLNKIPFQEQATGATSPTDAREVQVTQGGIATGIVSVPLRYMHTPSEVMCLADVQATIDLVCEYCRRIRPNTDFTPW